MSLSPACRLALVRMRFVLHGPSTLRDVLQQSGRDSQSCYSMCCSPTVPSHLLLLFAIRPTVISMPRLWDPQATGAWKKSTWSQAFSIYLAKELLLYNFDVLVLCPRNVGYYRPEGQKAAIHPGLVAIQRFSRVLDRRRII